MTPIILTIVWMVTVFVFSIASTLFALREVRRRQSVPHSATSLGSRTS